ncbi:DUF5825 family protein [Nonomuraea sp. B10E15]|uniref:DUF5825 family protein n=1 Tax=unclassified Nonomuraea TaxID=2593643 RepID=UPI00325E9E09
MSSSPLSSGPPPPGTVITAGRPITLGERPEETVAFIAVLRDNLERGTVVDWTGGVRPGFDTAPLLHLPPPRRPVPAAGQEGSAGLDVWRSRFRIGLCYYRRGPGFLQVKDMRDPAAAARMIIDDGALGSAFTRCLRPRRLPGLGTDERDAVDVLIDERLVLRCGDLVVTLPHRMRRWPVPAMAV